MRIKPEDDVFAPIARGVAQGGVRVANERAVLALIAGIPGVSNADIARMSGLGPQTTSRILTDLETRELILRGEVLRGRRGQPATPYRINPVGAFSIGAEIGWDHLELVLQNFMGETLAVVRKPHGGPVTETVLETIAAEAAALKATLPEGHRDRLAGIGIASPLDFRALPGDGNIGAADPDAWSRIDIAGRVSAATGLAAIWASDGNAITLAELVTQPFPRPSAIAAFFLGTYLAGGITGRSRLLDGARGLAAHPGATMVSGPQGKPVPLQALASLRALSQAVEAAGNTVPLRQSRDWNWDELAPHVEPWLESAAGALAQAVLSTSAMTGIDYCVIDGDLPPEILTRLVDRTAQHLSRLPAHLPALPQVVAGTVGAKAAALGVANMLVYQQFFSRDWELFDALAAN